MYINEEADMGFYTRVGVIPFTNLTSERNASEKVTSSFITELLKLEAVDVATMGDFTRVVSDVVKGGLTNSLVDLTSEQARIIGEQTNVEGIFVGAVQEYGMVRSGQEQFPLVSVIVRFIDAPTGRVVWSYEVTRKGGPKFPIFSFGETHTLGAMTTKVTSEIARSFGQAAK
jgi:hypothetical protein